MSDFMYILLLIVAVVVVTFALVFDSKKRKKYMGDQRENNVDKQAMLDLMKLEMQDAFDNYSYAVGYYTKIQHKVGETVYYYFPYFLAFSEKELIVFGFIRQNGKLFLRNRLQVDWNSMKFQYKLSKKRLLITLRVIGEKLSIFVEPVISSNGQERSDRPLCVYQEEEYERLKGYLEGYQRLTKG